MFSFARNRSNSAGPATPGIISLSAIALLVIGMGVVLAGERSYHSRIINEANVQAQILAAAVSPALVFDDDKAAQEYMNALQANPQIEAVVVYRSDGTMFAHYTRTPNIPVPARPLTSEPSIERDRLSLEVPVLQDNASVGTVYLRMLTEGISVRLRRYSIVALLTSLGLMVLLVQYRSQRALTGANAELEARAADLAAVNANLQSVMEEREQAEEGLRRAQKMEAIGQLTGGVAHDFNNLLSVIIGNLDLVQIRPGDQARVLRLTKGATEAAERGARLVEQLLIFARRQPMRPEHADPSVLIRNFEPLMRPATGGQIEVSLELADLSCMARIDPGQFESAILNLVVNSREAIAGTGKVRIRTSVEEIDADKAARVSDLEPGRYVIVEVSDTGCGISPEVLPQIFDPFFTTKEVGKGSGLGLSQVYGFAKESNGSVAVESVVGQGTTVQLYLPAVEPCDVSLVPAAVANPSPRETPDNETVLVVEDERIVLAMAVESISQLGYRVLSAVSATKALEILNSETHIDILFSDVVMPGEMNGVQLAAAASQIRPSMKVLLTSGYTAGALRAEHGLVQDIALLPKPYRSQELAAQLRQMTHAA